MVGLMFFEFWGCMFDFKFLEMLVFLLFMNLGPNFVENFVPGVSVFLPLFVSPSLFPCVRIYLFRNLCLFLFIFFVYPNLFLFGVCASLSLFVCLCFSVSRIVSIYLCLFLCVRVYRLFLFLCVFLCFFVYFRVFVSIYLGNVYLFLFLCFCLFALVFMGWFLNITYFYVVMCCIFALVPNYSVFFFLIFLFWFFIFLIYILLIFFGFVIDGIYGCFLIYIYIL